MSLVEAETSARHNAPAKKGKVQQYPFAMLTFQHVMQGLLDSEVDTRSLMKVLLTRWPQDDVRFFALRNTE